MDPGSKPTITQPTTYALPSSRVYFPSSTLKPTPRAVREAAAVGQKAKTNLEGSRRVEKQGAKEGEQEKGSWSCVPVKDRYSVHRKATVKKHTAIPVTRSLKSLFKAFPPASCLSTKIQRIEFWQESEIHSKPIG